MGYGMKGHIGWSNQASFGTATSAFEFMPIISENITTAIEPLTQEGMRGDFLEPPSEDGPLTVAGDIVFEPNPELIGLVLRAVTGQASGTLVASVTTWEFLPRQVDFTAEKTALPPVTLEVYRDTTKAWQFTDTVVNQISFEIGANAIVRATASVMARVSSLATKNTPSFPDGNPWTWQQASLSIAGTANTVMETMNITFNNNLEGVPTLNNTKEIEKFKRTTWQSVGVTGTLCFDNEDEYDVFRAETEQRFLLNLSGASITGSQSNELLLDLPKVRYTSFPVNMGGAGRITVGFDGNAKSDVNSSYAIKYTLTNTRVTY
jgi:hypothetical protein